MEGAGGRQTPVGFLDGFLDADILSLDAERRELADLATRDEAPAEPGSARALARALRGRRLELVQAELRLLRGAAARGMPRP